MKKYLAEFTGTFVIVFCGTGAIILNHESGGTIGNAGIATAFGLSVALMIYIFGNASGAHFNPAVTLTFYLTRKLNSKQFIPYLLSQFSGALSASLILKYYFPSDPLLGSTLPSGTETQSFILELGLTFFLLLSILIATSRLKKGLLFTGILIGGVVLLEAFFAGPVSGASMNPFRSLAPALASSATQHLWIYLTAPLCSAILISLLWIYLDPKTERSGKLFKSK